MTDIFSKKKRSEIMSLIRSKNTKPEIALRKLVSTALYPKGYRFKIHYKKLIGNPDIVFVKNKIAIFVDGSFWHGYNFKKSKKFLKTKFWLTKIEGNIARDKKVNSTLRKQGWKILRFWDHQIKKNPEKVIKKILQYLEA